LAVYKFVCSLEGTTRVRARRFVAAFLLRITNSNCSGADEPRLRATKNHSRRLQAAVFVRFFSATFFVRWNCCAIPSSRTKNVSCFTVMRIFFAPNFVVAPRHPWRGEFVG
jgi:hypothetical protein